MNVDCAIDVCAHLEHKTHTMCVLLANNFSVIYIFLGQCTVISNLVINTHKFASVGQKATTAAVSQQCMHSILLVVVNNIVHSAHLYTLAISKTQLAIWCKAHVRYGAQ